MTLSEKLAAMLLIKLKRDLGVDNINPDTWQKTPLGILYRRTSAAIRLVRIQDALKVSFQPVLTNAGIPFSNQKWIKFLRQITEGSSAEDAIEELRNAIASGN